MTIIRMPTRAVLWLMLISVSLLARSVVATEVDVPSVSVPPEAKVTAQHLSKTFATLCGRTKDPCLPPLWLGITKERAHTLSFVREGANLWIVFDEVVPECFACVPVSLKAIHVRRQAIMLDQTGVILKKTDETSGNNFATATPARALAWPTAIEVMLTADQFLSEMSTHVLGRGI